MIAADDDGGGQLAVGDHLVEREPQAMALPQAYPANARGQTLEVDAIAGHVEPMMQMRVVGNQLPDFRVRLVNILRIPGQRGPAKRPDAAAEKRTDVLGHEAWNVEGALDAGILGHLPQIVA